MKKVIYVIGFLFLALSSCKEEVDPILICGVTDPVESLDWLNTLANEIDEVYDGPYYYIVATKWEGNDVFVLANCCPTCNSVDVVYSCEGEALGFLSANAGINPDILDEGMVIWRSTGFACSI